MRFKIDESVHSSAAEWLLQQGHDALTVWDQQLRGSSEDRIAEVCQSENRALLSLDVDFADMRRYPPESFAGIVVLRLHRQDRAFVIRILQRIAPLFQTETLIGRLWIVEETRVRIRGGSSKDSVDLTT